MVIVVVWKPSCLSEVKGFLLSQKKEIRKVYPECLKKAEDELGARKGCALVWGEGLRWGVTETH